MTPPAHDHRARRDRVRRRLEEDDLGGVLVVHVPNIRWATGFTGSSATLLVARDPEADLLITDGRYRDQVADEVPDVEATIARTGAAELALDRLTGPTLAFESDHIDWRSGQDLLDLAGERGIEPVPSGGLIERLRAVKDDGEIAVLRRACEITDEAFADLLTWLAPGLTEREVAVRLERTMVDLGAEAPAFDSIVASGPNSARPHHRHTERAIAAGDPVQLDVGARVAGYHADMSRVVAVGGASELVREIHGVVAGAQRAGVAAVRAGVEARAVDGVCRGRIDAAGYGDRFVHGTGHGVGLEVHEWPRLGRETRATLAARTTVTVEPGIYLTGTGGVRIEDTVVVQPDGPAETLTTAPRDLLVV